MPKRRANGEGNIRKRKDGRWEGQMCIRDSLGTATRISASLFRRLSAFFWSTPGQDPKAVKFAVLNPGHAGFPKRVEHSEGSNSAPIRNTPCFAV